jgi:REP element-mobilizing transposase RayT
MADTYTQIHIHIVFAVKFRRSLIGIEWQDELFKYITGIVQNNKHKMLSINCMPDHIHILIGMQPSQSLSDLVQDIKGDSSKWINSKQFINQRFAWQHSYGAFSYSKSQISRVMNYIENQQKHHAKKDFITEYTGILDHFGVVYNQNTLFKPPI